MKTLTNMTLAALVATTLLSACDFGGAEEERVLFNLVRSETPTRIVLDGHQTDDGCTVIDIVPQAGLAMVKDLCGQSMASVRLPDGLVEQLQIAADTGLAVDSGRIVVVKNAFGENFEVPLTEELDEVLEEVYELAEEAGSGGQPVEVDIEEDSPEQTAVGMSSDTGFIFGAGSLFEAVPQKVDILAYSGTTGMDLVPGLDPVTGEQRRLHIFRDSHGEPALFNDLHELPNYSLIEADTDQVRDARKGMAFVIENNVSGGVTYVFVKQASNTKVELEYQAVK